MSHRQGTVTAARWFWPAGINPSICYIHMDARPADYLACTAPAHNIIGLCTECLAWWRADDPKSLCWARTYDRTQQ